MNARQILSSMPLAALVAISSCDKDSKVFSSPDLSPERSTVAGRVTGVGDTGISGVVVTAQAVDDAGQIQATTPAQTTLSGVQGRFSMDLRPGTHWKISWQSPDYKAPDNGDVVKLGLRETVDLTAKPKRLTYRYGWIAGRTLPGTAIAVDGQDVSTTADNQGFFKLARVLPGNNVIVGMLPGKGCWRVKDSLSPEGIDTIKGVEQAATWSHLSAMSGTLTNQDGSPQVGAILSAMGGLVRDTTDAQGSFHLANLPAKGRVAITVDRGLAGQDRLLLPCAPEDSTWDLGAIPVSGSVTGPGVSLGSSVVLADPGDIVNLSLVWNLLDPKRNVIGFAWDTTGKGQSANAIRTWGPRLTNYRVGAQNQAISVWVTVASPLPDGTFDTLWSSEARINVVVRQKAKQLDSVPPPTFSLEAGSYTYPTNFVLTDSDSLANISWTADTTAHDSWKQVDAGDSILLDLGTSTIYAVAKRNHYANSRMVSRTYQVSSPAKAVTLAAAISGNLTLPKGSDYVATKTPTFSAASQLVLDSGAILRIPQGSDLEINNGGTLVMYPGSKIFLGPGCQIKVGDGTAGRILVKGRVDRRAAIVSSDPNNLAGFKGYYALSLNGMANGSSIQGLDLNGSNGSGILVYNTEVDIVDSRIRNCKEAGILFDGTGRAATIGGVRSDSLAGNRWGIQTTPFAMGRIATNPGLTDTLRIVEGTGTNDIAGSATWSRQPNPIVVNTGITVDQGADLTLGAGIVLLFDNGTTVDVGYYAAASLNIVGTESDPVVLRAHAAPGWGSTPGSETNGAIQLFAKAGTVSIQHLVLTGSQSNGIYSQAELDNRDSRLDSNKVSGIQFDQTGRPIDGSFTGMSAKGNRWSVSSTPYALGNIPTNLGLLDTVRIFEKSTNNISGAAIWSRQPNPIVVNTGITVDQGANLTLGAGIALLFDNGTSVDVGYYAAASLNIVGTESAPVVLRAHATPGWGNSPGSETHGAIQLFDKAVTVSIQHLVLTGSQSNGIYSQVELDIRDSRLDSNKVSGIRFDEASRPVNGSFTGMSAKGNRWSVSSTPYALGSIPTNPGLLDTVRIIDEKNNDIQGFATWAPQPNPIVVADVIKVDGGASLTLSGGIALLFDNGKYLSVGYYTPTSIQIDGTSSAPVRFAGHGSYWGYNTTKATGAGIYLYGYTTSANIHDLELSDLPVNGIAVDVDQPNVVAIRNVKFTQTNAPIDSTYAVNLTGTTVQRDIDSTTIQGGVGP